MIKKCRVFLNQHERFLFTFQTKALSTTFHREFLCCIYLPKGRHEQTLAATTILEYGENRNVGDPKKYYRDILANKSLLS